MKMLVVAIVAVVAAYFLFLGPNPVFKLAASSSEATAPAQAMGDLVRDFPKRIFLNNGHGGWELTKVSYDVQKTDSLVNPVVGTLNFSTDIDLQYVFQWTDGRWVFTRMVCTENGLDFTDTPGGLEIMDDPTMKQFLDRHR